MKWQVLGNGPQLSNAIEGMNLRHTIVFNRGFPQVLEGCRIENQRISGSGSKLSVSGYPPYLEFEQVLIEQHANLYSVLNSPPSSGLCCLFALLGKSIDVSVTRMNLLPSLTRDNSLPLRKPIACHFHNWLGERRLILPYITHIDWPQFYLPPIAITRSQRGNPYELLTKLTTLKKPTAMYAIQQLAKIDSQDWINYDDLALTKSVDSLFYLSRTESHTMNWWLYDDQASKLIDIIHYQLAWAQQQFAM